MNVPTLIIGETGSGKSSCFRNLPPEKTVILNTERKPMPFKGFKNFKNIDISSVKKTTSLIRELRDNKEYEYVIIDSFTSYHEYALKLAKATGDGYSTWTDYATHLYELVQMLKDLPQQVFITSIPEYLEKSLGELKGYARAKGKEMRYGAIEKEFAIVLWTKLIEDDDGIVTDFQFEYKPNKHNTAKAPHEMFEGDVLNDAMIVSENINEYYS